MYILLYSFWIGVMIQMQGTTREHTTIVEESQTKGQSILKCLFGVFIFFQKTNENELT